MNDMTDSAIEVGITLALGSVCGAVLAIGFAGPHIERLTLRDTRIQSGIECNEQVAGVVSSGGTCQLVWRWVEDEP